MSDPTQHNELDDERLTLTSFGVKQPVPSNLIFLCIVILGIVLGTNLRREFFPEVRPNLASITVPYPGASPTEIEEGLVLKIEDRLAELDEVTEIRSTIVEGIGTIVVEFRRDIDDIDQAVNTVESAIDSLTDLPEDAQRIRTAKFEPRLQVIQLALNGRGDQAEMKRAIRLVRDDLKSLPGMGNVILSGLRLSEIKVEVNADAMLRYELSLPQIAQTVRDWMKDVPGGTVRTQTLNIRIRSLGVPEKAEAIKEIVVKSTPDGAVVRLGDVATVTDGFEESQVLGRLNGEDVVTLTAFNVGDGDAVAVAEMVRAYVHGRNHDGDPYIPRAIERIYDLLNSKATKKYESARADYEKAVAVGDTSAQPPLPPKLLKTDRRRAYEMGRSRTEPLPGKLIMFSDLARFIEGRLDLLTRNAKWGALLVFLTLLTFLNLRVAMWVMLGLITSVLGTLAFMSVIGVTLNLLTMFGLIIVLGLLTDDAIVVAENIVSRHESGEPALLASIRGTRQVAWPVVATVLTTVAAFFPLRLVEGQIGDFLGALPLVVACALSISLLEALVILPAHMSHSLARMERRSKEPVFIIRAFRSLERKRNTLLNERIIPAFGRFLEVSISHRYITAATALAIWIVSLGMVVGRHVEFTFFAGSDSETFVIGVEMPIGTPVERTDAVVRKLEQACDAQPEVRLITPIIGFKFDLNDFTPGPPQSHLAQVFVELEPVENRDRISADIIASVRERIGRPAGVKHIRFEELQGGVGGPAINLAVTGDHEPDILAAADEVKEALSEFAGVVDLGDNADAGQRELKFELYDGSATLGLTPESIANQLRGYLFGLEPHTFSAHEEDVDVRVMLDDTSRHSLAGLESQYVFTPAGERVPLAEVAAIGQGAGYATIRRLNRKRSVTVSGDVDSAVNNPERVLAMAQPSFDRIVQDYPGITIEPRGRQLETTRSLRGIRRGFMLAALLIYVILAWLFRSYFQPFAVMLAVPFAMIGMIWGHYIFGYKMMILSLIGFVALAGIVVNDSLIYVDFYNGLRRKGTPMRVALVQSGMRRLRPILLTTMTTVLGLSPLMLERSFQARFLIPMAITISFGLMSATLVVLAVLPSLMLIGADIRWLLTALWTGRWSTPPQPTVEIR